MGRRKSTRGQRRASKRERKSYMKGYMAVYREQQIKWNHKLKLLAAISPPQVKWPKTRDVSWETPPELILQLDKDGMLPPQLKTTDVDVWDPCFFNGNVKNTWRRVGISIRHSCEDFWTTWSKRLTPRIVILTNPPFDQVWLEPFFEFLTTLDNPFFIVLHNKAPDRLYFGRHLFDRIRRKRELKIYHLQRSYKMKQKGGRLAGFAGLTICCYFPKHWMFKVDESKYARVISISSLHSTH